MLRPERLVIRPARPKDAEPLFEVFGDAQTMRYWDSLPDTSIEMTAQRVQQMASIEAPSYFVLEHNGQPIGTAGIHSGNEIGFILHRAFWRKGLMREALSTIIPWAFDQLDLSQITADTDPRNTGSIALLTGLGFVETGRASHTIKVGDHWCDSVYFRLDRA